MAEGGYSIYSRETPSTHPRTQGTTNFTLWINHALELQSKLIVLVIIGVFIIIYCQHHCMKICIAEVTEATSDTSDNVVQ